jgi:hypothetical protein
MYANYRIIKLLTRESNYNCRAKIVLHVCSSQKHSPYSFGNRKDRGS